MTKFFGFGLLSFLVTGSLTTLAQESTLASWTERVNIQGDFRYRHESVIYENATLGADDVKTHRGRIRARLGLNGKVNEDVTLYLKLATSSGGQRNSYNQTLTSAGSKKDIYLDWAFAQWNLGEDTLLALGKFGTPFETVGQSQIIFDVDFTPEGLAFTSSKNLGALTLETRLGGFWMVDRSEGNDGTDRDSGLFGAQVGAVYPFSTGQVELFVADYYFNNFKDQAVLTGGPSGNSSTFDSVRNQDVYLYDYNLLNAGLSYQFEVADSAVEFYLDYVHNTALSDENTGYIAGLSWGRVKQPGDWKLGYNWRKIEADAVLATLADSDFSSGTTDTQGHSATFAYGVQKGVEAALSYYQSELGIDNSRDYSRVHLDLNLKF